MKYAVWDDGSLYHARNLDNVRTVEGLLSIPTTALILDAETCRQAVEKFKCTCREANMVEV